jgi:cell division protein FtsB
MSHAPTAPDDPTRPHKVAVVTLAVVLLLTLPRWVLTHDHRDRLDEQVDAYLAQRAENDERVQRNGDLHQRLQDFDLSGDASEVRVRRAAKERYIRDELGYVRRGEVVVIVRPEAP